MNPAARPARFAALASLALGTVASAASITIPASQDAMIFGTSANADTNNASGRGPALFAGADGSGNKKRSLLQFNIAGNVPAGATVTGVTLTLYLAQIAGSGAGGTGGAIPSRTYNLYDNAQAWTEGNSGSPTSASVGGTGQGYARVTGDTSWDYASYNSADPTAGKWTSGGTALHGGNFVSTASATSTFTSFIVNNPFTWSSSGLVADVQDWLNNPSDNDGWMLKSETGLDTNGDTVVLENTATSFLGFWSRDGAAANNNAGIAPALTITYAVVPEPSSAALALAVGLPRMFRRHRRA